MWIPFIFTAATAAAACDPPPNVCPEGTSPVKDKGCVPTACEGPGCVPDDPGTGKACYSGPPGTLGKGICAAGTQTCNEDGSGCGPCVGETLPKPLEDCATLEDDDCDGQATCDGAALWSKAWGSAYTDIGESVAADADDNIYLAGRIGGPVDFGGGLLTPANPESPDVFLVKYDASGNYVWDRLFHAPKGFSPYGLDLRADVAGGLYLSGAFDGSLDLGAGCKISTSFPQTAFLAKLDPSGACVWAKPFGEGTISQYVSVRVSAAGELLLVGLFYGTLTIGSTTLSNQGDSDGFVAKLDADGDPLWAKAFGGPARDVIDATFDSKGGVIVYGALQGDEVLDGESVPSAGSSSFFVLSYAPDGGKRWPPKIVSDAAYPASGKVLVDPASDDIIIIGNDPLGTTFALKMKSDGSGFGGKSFTGGQVQILDAQLDPFGNMVFIGRSLGGTDFGGGPLLTASDDSTVVVKLDPKGEHIWSHLFVGEGNSLPIHLALDRHGNAIVTGQFKNTIGFGSMTLTATPGADPCPSSFLGCDDGFLAKLGP
jgi:hypothetical protein